MKILTRREKLIFGKISEQILAGNGSGHRSAYRQWLQLRKKNTSERSNQVEGWVEPLGRTATYMSRGEFRTATLLLWLGVSDLREQYPIWPTSHPHPLEGAEMAPANLPWSKGLLKIASDAGIDHGYEANTTIPYIATIDFAATVVFDGIARLYLLSLKPIKDEDSEVEWNTAARLELERRYAQEISVPYQLVYSGIVTKTVKLHRNLTHLPHEFATESDPR